MTNPTTITTNNNNSNNTHTSNSNNTTTTTDNNTNTYSKNAHHPVSSSHRWLTVFLERKREREVQIGADPPPPCLQMGDGVPGDVRAHRKAASGAEPLYK